MTNEAAIGYMILAANEMELDKKTINNLESIMLCQMDFKTEGEAAQAYLKN